MSSTHSRPFDNMPTVAMSICAYSLIVRGANLKLRGDPMDVQSLVSSLPESKGTADIRHDLADKIYTYRWFVISWRLVITALAAGGVFTIGLLSGEGFELSSLAGVAVLVLGVRLTWWALVHVDDDQRRFPGT